MFFSGFANLCLESCGAPLIVTRQKSGFYPQLNTSLMSFQTMAQSSYFGFSAVVLISVFLLPPGVGCKRGKSKGDGSGRSAARRALVLAERAAGMKRKINPPFFSPPSHKPYPGLNGAVITKG